MSDARALLQHPQVARLARTLQSARGRLADVEVAVRRAAVALVLRADVDGALQLLFIKRAEYPGDPWSGQIAFPGGRREPEDSGLRVTAVRETLEETGVDIDRHGLLIGTLDELHPRTPVLPPIVVRPYVAVVGPEAELSPSEEVAAAFWAPVEALRHRDATFEAIVRVRDEELRVPGLRYAEYTIWGMTERIYRDFERRLDAALLGD